jgi:hypothetical protein
MIDPIDVEIKFLKMIRAMRKWAPVFLGFIDNSLVIRAELKRTMKDFTDMFVTYATENPDMDRDVWLRNVERIN